MREIRSCGLLKEIIIRMIPRKTGDNLVMDIVKEHGKLQLVSKYVQPEIRRRCWERVGC